MDRRRVQLEAPVVLAHGVRELRAARHDEQWVAVARRRRSCGTATGPHRHPPRARARRRPCMTVSMCGTQPLGQQTRRARRPAPRHARPRSKAARRPRAPSAQRPRRPGRPPRPAGPPAGLPRGARSTPADPRLDLAHLLRVQEGWAIGADLLRGHLLRVGTHEPRHALARELDGRGSPVRRGARVRAGRDVAEDQLHVGADRDKSPRRPGTTLLAHRHPRGDRREVGAQRAGVDELAGQQPVEIGVRPTLLPDWIGDRNDVGGRAADVDPPPSAHPRPPPARTPHSPGRDFGCARPRLRAGHLTGARGTRQAPRQAATTPLPRRRAPQSHGSALVRPASDSSAGRLPTNVTASTVLRRHAGDDDETHGRQPASRSNQKPPMRRPRRACPPPVPRSTPPSRRPCPRRGRRRRPCATLPGDGDPPGHRSQERQPPYTPCAASANATARGPARSSPAPSTPVPVARAVRKALDSMKSTPADERDPGLTAALRGPRRFGAPASPG